MKMFRSVLAILALSVCVTDAYTGSYVSAGGGNGCDACVQAGPGLRKGKSSKGSRGGSKAKLSSITVQYTGSVANGNANSQGSRAYFRVSGELPDSGTFTSDGQVYPGISIGDSFTVPVDGSNTEVYVGSSLVNIHTSCSAALRLGDNFGFLELVGFQQEDGTTEVDTGCLPPGPICYEYNEPCPTARPPGPPPPCEICGIGGGRGGFGLILQVVGGSPNTITNDQSGKGYASGDSITATGTISVRCFNKKQTSEVFFDGSIDDDYIFQTSDGLDTETECIVTAGSSQQTIGIHTSCSKDLEVGFQFGALQIIGFTVNGQSSITGNVCPEAPVYPTPPCPQCCVDPPVKVTDPSSLITAKTDICTDNALPSPELNTLRTWFNSNAGMVCSTSNLGDNAGITYEVRNNGVATTVDELEQMLCTSEDYCPDINVTVCCRETCSPGESAFDEICSDPVDFEVGFESPTECPGETTTVIPGNCPNAVVCDSRDRERPSTLTFKLVGGGPTVSNSQEGKASASGSTLTAGSFTSATCGSFSGDVLTVSGPFGTQTDCTFSGPGGTQTVSLHTSCSKPLVVGDLFGAIQLTGFSNSQGGSSSCPDVTVVTPAAPCPMCCVMQPYANFPEDVSDRKDEDCTDSQLPQELYNRVDAWLNSFTCSLRNTPMGTPGATKYLLTGDSRVEVQTAADVEGALCATQEGEVCHFIQVEFICCDPCRPEDSPDGSLCVSEIASYDLYDDTNPQIPFDDQTIECSADVAEEQQLFTTWSQSPRCRLADGGSPVVTIDAPEGDGRCNQITPATATCTDRCGNDKVKTRRFSIIDTQPPVIATEAADLTVECSDDSTVTTAYQQWLSANGNALALDCRDDVAWSNNADDLDNTNCASTTVQFTAEDPCGNLATTSASFTVQDTGAPQITLPNGTACAAGQVCITETVECSGQTQLEDVLSTYSGLLCSDTCDDSPYWIGHTIVSQSHLENNCASSVLIEYTCADICGNTVTALAEFNTIDNTPPFIDGDGPEDHTVECDGEGNIAELEEWLHYWSGLHPVQWADDLCQRNPSCYNPYHDYEADYYGDTQPVGTYLNYKLQGVCSTTYQAEVCANGVTYINHCVAMQNGNMYYTEGACDSYAAPPPTSNSYANCSYCSSYGDETVCADGVEYNNYCFAYCMVGAYRVSLGPCSQQSTEAPYTGTSAPGYAGQVTGGHQYVTVSPNCNCPDTVDEICGSDGNTYMSRCVAECHGIRKYELGSCHAMNCGYSQLVYTATVSGRTTTDGCIRTTPYRFMVTDQCNTGELTADANFVTTDTTPPVITGTVPETVVECDGNGNLGAFYEWLATNAGASCSDSCTDCSWNEPTYDEDEQGNPVFTDCGEPSTGYYSPHAPDFCASDRCVVVTFEAQDECGNAVQTAAVFRTQDTTPPLINGMNTMAECSPSVMADYSNWLTNDGDAVAVDVPDCSGVDENGIESHIQLFPSDGYVIPTGIHGTPPGALPADVIHELQQVYEGDYFSSNGSCPFITVLTISAKDRACNKRARNISYIIADTTPPTFTTPPADTTAECSSWGSWSMVDFEEWLITGGGGVCADSCDLLPLPNTVPKYDIVPEITGACPESVTVDFYCEDFCGNRAVMPATFYVDDTTPPTITDPRDKVVECGDDAGKQRQLDLWLSQNGKSTGYDTCTATEMLNWTYTGGVFTQDSSDTSRPNKCNNRHADANFTATDQCGNSVTKGATFRVRDTIAPEFTDLGFDLEYACDLRCANAEDNAVAVALKWANRNGCLAADDCQEYMEWSYIGLPDGQLCGTSGTVTFTVMDGCGNTNERTIRYNFPEIPAPLPVIPAPPPPVDCEICRDQSNNKRDLTALTFRWVSSSSTVVSASNGIVSNGGSVASGGTITISTTRPGRKFDGANMDITTTMGSATLHVSCSQPIYIGLRVAFGSSYLELVGFNSLQGSSDSICGPPPSPTPQPSPPTPENCPLDIDSIDVCTCIPQPAPPPPPPPPAQDVCANGKPTLIEFVYTGGAGLSNNQEGKASFSGSSIDTETARVQCIRTQKGQASPLQVVSRGGTYVVNGNGNKVGTEITCTIQGISGSSIVATATVAIHTSCSKPLNVGDTFGPLTVSCFMTNTGSTCTRFNQPTGPVGGAQPARCPTYAPPPTQIAPPPPGPPNPSCDACTPKQKLSSITLRYIGGNQLTNTQEGKASVTGGSITGSTVSIACDANMMNVFANAKKSKGGSGSGGSGSGMVSVSADGYFAISNFNSETVCTITDGIRIQEVEIHTSCSKPLRIGDIFGSIVVTAFNGDSTGIVAEENGCPAASSSMRIAPTMPPTARPCAGQDMCTDRAKLTHITLEYSLPFVTNHNQEDSGYNVIVTDGTFRNTETIQITSADYGIDTTAVVVGQRFTLSAAAIGLDALPQAVNFWIGPRGGNSRTRFAVNCKFPLSVGDQFGVLKVVGYANTNGDTCEVASDAATAELSKPGSESAVEDTTKNGEIAGIVAGCVLAVMLMLSIYKVRTIQGKSTHDVVINDNASSAQSDDYVWDPNSSSIDSETTGI